MFGKFNHDQPKLLDKSEGIQHFSLRKLSVGLASVALATTFLVSGPGQAKAETTDSSQQTAQVEAKSTTTGSEETDAKQVAASASTVEAAAKSVASSDENGGGSKEK